MKWETTLSFDCRNCSDWSWWDVSTHQNFLFRFYGNIQKKRTKQHHLIMVRNLFRRVHQKQKCLGGVLPQDTFYSISNLTNFKNCWRAKGKIWKFRRVKSGNSGWFRPWKICFSLWQLPWFNGSHDLWSGPLARSGDIPCCTESCSISQW